jgi:glutamate/tyrosine decarboxylase-like PLP-dependent enzyme
MEIPRDSSSQQFAQARAALVRMASSPGAPTLDVRGSRAVEAWFLGPKAENADELERLVVEAVRDQAFWRRNYFPGDPTHITESVKQSPEYLEASGALRDGFRELLAFLKKSVPFFSMRYQGHMNWDLTLPGIAGYFAAMLYNPNNVAFEGSTATTLLELLVGDDLCRMLGYEILPSATVDVKAVRPWGHITCDGTVANIEAIWAARNLKFFPLSLQAALATDPALTSARELTIPLPTGGSAKLLDLDRWQLLNLTANDVLALPGRLSAEYGFSRDTVSRAVGMYLLQTLGWLGFGRRFLSDIADPVFTVPGSKHYSFPKAAAVLGIGSGNLVNIAVDLDARQDPNDLRTKLEGFLAQRRPVLAVVAVIGTTEESAVDPLADILQLRDDFAKRGLVFHVHADAAWGGYHRSLINDEFNLPAPELARATLEPPPAAPLSAYVTRQFEVLGRADSITVDPHKSGYIPYPAGALCYRNSSMRDLVTFSAPVVFHGGAEPTIGIYGIEGSKPGAAAAAVYLSHRVIRPTRSGYGKIIGEALFSCRKLYARLLSMDLPQQRLKAIPVPRLPTERQGGDGSADRKRIADLIDRQSGAQIRENSAALALLKEIGPDQNILAYAFNFYDREGVLNTDLEMANRLNRAIYDHLSIKPGDDIYGHPMIVSTTDLDAAAYGPAFIEDYKRRLGVTGSTGTSVTVLRSVVMDPWVSDTSAGSFIDILEAEIRKAATAALAAISLSQTTGY